MPAELTVTPAACADDFAALGALFRDYVAWCRERLGGNAWVIDSVFAQQSLDDELLQLPSKYSPPQGAAFLARIDGEACGCVAYRRLDDETCEMKRMFVRKGAQGAGVGRALCEVVIQAASAEGYAAMRLDTMRVMTEAIAMYEAFGFRRRDPYVAYSEAMLPNMAFMEIALRRD
jgi:GNAT superfamily N-acetyltransferase